LDLHSCSSFLMLECFISICIAPSFVAFKALFFEFCLILLLNAWFYFALFFHNWGDS
jgi:hypothetical protein